jgi:hypothetical protein
MGSRCTKKSSCVVAARTRDSVLSVQQAIQQQVVTIYRSGKYTQEEVGRRFNLNRKTVYAISRRSRPITGLTYEGELYSDITDFILRTNLDVNEIVWIWRRFKGELEKGNLQPEQLNNGPDIYDIYEISGSD